MAWVTLFKPSIGQNGPNGQNQRYPIVSAVCVALLKD